MEWLGDAVGWLGALGTLAGVMIAGLALYWSRKSATNPTAYLTMNTVGSGGATLFVNIDNPTRFVVLLEKLDMVSPSDVRLAIQKKHPESSPYNPKFLEPELFSSLPMSVEVAPNGKSRKLITVAMAASKRPIEVRMAASIRVMRRRAKRKTIPVSTIIPEVTTKNKG
jgi:hypothetical protein